MNYLNYFAKYLTEIFYVQLNYLYICKHITCIYYIYIFSLYLFLYFYFTYLKIDECFLINKLGGNEISGMGTPLLDGSQRMSSHANVKVSDAFDFCYQLGMGTDLFSPITKELFAQNNLSYDTLKYSNYFPPPDYVNHVFSVHCPSRVNAASYKETNVFSNNSVIRCMYTNATSLNTSKLNELATICENESHHLLFITETWWKSKSTVNLPNYTVYRKDRQSRSGGGVAIYVRKDLISCEIELVRNTESEQLWVQLHIANEKILLGCIYRPPLIKSDSDSHILDAFTRVNRLLSSKKYDSVIIAGDFNLPTIKWDNGNALVEPGFNHELAAEVVDSLTENNLHQMVDFATFTNSSGLSGNVLDFIITDQPIRMQHIGQSSPLGDTQQFHIIINCEFRIKNTISTKTFNSKIFNYKKGNYDSFNNFIATHDWNALLDTGNNVNQNFELFSDVYKSACNQFIPKVNSRINKKQRSPWMTPELLMLLQHKKHLFYKNKSANWKSAEEVQQYRSARKNLRKAIKKRILEYEMNLASDKKNPKRLYAYINSKQNISCAINSIMTSEGTLSTDRTVIADNLNRQFASVFVDEPALEDLPAFQSRTNAVIDSVIISTSEVLKYLSKIDPNKSQGPDGMHPLVFRNAASSLHVPIAIISSNHWTRENFLRLGWTQM